MCGGKSETGNRLRCREKDETIMLNVTGGGMLSATRKGFILKEPDLVLSPELPAEEIIAAIDKLF